VVPNKFPALRPDAAPYHAPHDALHDQRAGYGFHEIVIESPHHRQTLDALPVNQVTEIFWAIRQRMDHFRRMHGIVYAQVFKNHGREAGASLEHPHCQILAMPVIPVQLEEELAGCQGYHVRHGACVFCDLTDRELSEHSRVVQANNHFVAICPYASRFPYEVWVIPRDHQADFTEASPEQMRALGETMQLVLQRMRRGLGDPAYNWMLHTAPYRLSPGRYHWHIEIIPKTTRVAGFEWGTGCYINPMPPEVAAAYLRHVEASIIHPRHLPHVSPHQAERPSAHAEAEDAADGLGRALLGA